MIQMYTYKYKKGGGGGIFNQLLKQQDRLIYIFPKSKLKNATGC